MNKTIVNYNRNLFHIDVQTAHATIDHGPTKGAYITAAKKRRKAQICIDHFLKFEAIDWTPTLVLHIIKPIVGRGVDMRKINDWFGTPGRTAANKTKELKRETLWVDGFRDALKTRLAEEEMWMLEICAQEKAKYRKKKGK